MGILQGIFKARGVKIKVRNLNILLKFTSKYIIIIIKK